MIRKYSLAEPDPVLRVEQYDIVRAETWWIRTANSRTMDRRTRSWVRSENAIMMVLTIWLLEYKLLSCYGGTPAEMLGISGGLLFALRRNCKQTIVAYMSYGLPIESSARPRRDARWMNVPLDGDDERCGKGKDEVRNVEVGWFEC